MRPLVCLTCFACLTPAAGAVARPVVEKGTFQFRPVDDQKDVPTRYRLTERSFPFEMDRKTDLPAVEVAVYRLRFPSPIKSETPANNTVHAEYYRPAGKGPFPGVIILDITAGNQMLSRHMGAYLASQGVAGLFVQMAYYGPRRPQGSTLRLMSPNLPRTIGAVTQTVLDLRVAAAWLASRREIDRHRLGIVGTSLGSFIAALTAEMEPRLGRACVLLGGGGFVDGYADHPVALPFFNLYRAFGGKRETIKQVFEPIDPLTCAANLTRRKLLILAASRDDIVPPKMAKQLWEASGKQQIVWFDATHYGAALHIVEGLERVLEHFRAP